MNYFELFEIPVSLQVNQPALLKKYYVLCKQFHPDNFSLQDQKAQEDSETMASTINEAKKVLDDEDKRLQYILKENGTLLHDEKYTLSPTFLGDMMDINEQLMELEFKKNERRLAIIKLEIAEKESELSKEVKQYFDTENLALNEADNAALKEYYYKKKYLQRIKERLI